MAASFHNSSINGAYSRVAAGKIASSLPDAIVFSNQSENAFSLGPMEYTVLSSGFGLVPVVNHNHNRQPFRINGCTKLASYIEISIHHPIKH